MGLNNCAINADFILKDDKTYVLELGGRSGATCLAELVSIYYGYDYYEKLFARLLERIWSFRRISGTECQYASAAMTGMASFSPLRTGM